MLVISDTSPLNYLVLVNAVDILPKLFDEILVPPIVLRELAHPLAPAQVRAWAQHPPEWLQIRTPMQVESIFGLHLGETEAIALAEEVRADALLVDEREATRVALERGIPVVGTLAILAKGIAQGLIEQQSTINQLTQTNFYGPIELIEPLVRRFKNQ